jgi:hypothetical protein
VERGRQVRTDAVARVAGRGGLRSTNVLLRGDGGQAGGEVDGW